MKTEMKSPCEQMAEVDRFSFAVGGFLLVTGVASGIAHLTSTPLAAGFVILYAAVFITWLALPELFKRMAARIAGWAEAPVQETPTPTICTECSSRCHADVFGDDGTHTVTDPAGDKSTEVEVGK